MELVTIENKLYSIITEKLDMPKEINISQNLFNLGFQSITVMQLQKEIMKEFSVRIKFKELYDYSSIEGLSKVIQSRLAS